MKVLVMAWVCLLASVAYASSLDWPLKVANSARTTEVTSADWEAYKAAHGKSYATQQEDTQRRANFEATVRYIREHNAKKSSHKLGLNERSDWSDEERNRLLGFRPHPSRFSPITKALNAKRSEEFMRDLYKNNPEPAKAALDWRQVPGRVGEVKNQGNCGSCWAFSTTGLLEGQQKTQAKMSKFVSLSEQDLVDCSEQNYHCSGGDIVPALEDIAKMGGIQSERDYAYQGWPYPCSFKKSLAVMTDKTATVLNVTESELADVLAKYGPVSIGMYATRHLFEYEGGIFTDEFCTPKSDQNHAVLLVGYGTDDGTDYWLVKNSWGVEWGEQGYFRIKRGVNECNLIFGPVVAQL